MSHATKTKQQAESTAERSQRQALERQAKKQQEIYDEQVARLRVEQEVKDQKSVLRAAAQQVRNEVRARVIADARAKQERKDREYVRSLSREQRIGYRRKLVGGYMPDHILDELDRADGLVRAPVTASESKALSVDSLLDELKRRGVNAEITSRTVPEEVPLGFDPTHIEPEDNAAE